MSKRRREKSRSKTIVVGSIAKKLALTVTNYRWHGHHVMVVMAGQGLARKICTCGVPLYMSYNVVVRMSRECIYGGMTWWVSRLICRVACDIVSR